MFWNVADLKVFDEAVLGQDHKLNVHVPVGLWLRMNTISELSVDSSRGEMMDINVRSEVADHSSCACCNSS